MTLVVDASVVVRFGLPEAGCEPAERVIRRAAVHAPRLAWLEAANALRRRVGPGSVRGSAAVAFPRALPGLGSRAGPGGGSASGPSGSPTNLGEISGRLYLAPDAALVTAGRALVSRARRRHRAVVALADWR